MSPRKAKSKNEIIVKQANYDSIRAEAKELHEQGRALHGRHQDCLVIFRRMTSLYENIPDEALIEDDANLLMSTYAIIFENYDAIYKHNASDLDNNQIQQDITRFYILLERIDSLMDAGDEIYEIYVLAFIGVFFTRIGTPENKIAFYETVCEEIDVDLKRWLDDGLMDEDDFWVEKLIHTMWLMAIVDNHMGNDEKGSDRYLQVLKMYACVKGFRSDHAESLVSVFNNIRHALIYHDNESAIGIPLQFLSKVYKGESTFRDFVYASSSIKQYMDSHQKLARFFLAGMELVASHLDKGSLPDSDFTKHMQHSYYHAQFDNLYKEVKERATSLQSMLVHHPNLQGAMINEMRFLREENQQLHSELAELRKTIKNLDKRERAISQQGLFAEGDTKKPKHKEEPVAQHSYHLRSRR